MRGDLHPILGIPAFLLAIALAAPIFGWLRAEVITGPADGPGLLFPYLCCAFLPAFVVTGGVAVAIQSMFERASERAVDVIEDAVTGRQREREPLFALPTLSARQVIYLGGAAALACIAFAAWPGKVERKAPSAVDAPASEERARALARQAVVRRLSELGLDGVTFESRRTSVGGRPVWRVTTQGGAQPYVIDVGEGTRLNGWNQEEPAVDVYDPATAPPEDVEAIQAETIEAGGTAPVRS